MDGSVVSWSREYREGEVVLHVFGWRVRLYLGHSIHSGRRIRTWRMSDSRGIFVVPWNDRVIGIQWKHQ